jgi:hypothetical protein
VCIVKQASYGRSKIREISAMQNKCKISIFNIKDQALFYASDFFPIMFYLPLSTSATSEFDHGPSHAGVTKETKYIIDFLIS